MPNSDFTGINQQLQGDPQYRAALAGHYNPYNFPTGPDGLVLPGFRQQAARAYVDARFGRRPGTPAGAIRSNGEFYDPNDEPWYTDPRIMGPVAVGAASGIGAFAGGAGAGAAAPAATGSLTAPVSSNVAMPTFGAAGGAGAASGAGSTAASGAAAATGSSVLGRTMQALAGGLPIVGALTNRNAGGSLGSNINDVMQALPELRQMLNLQMGQAQRADPLHQSLVTLSQRLLPNSAR